MVSFQRVLKHAAAAFVVRFKCRTWCNSMRGRVLQSPYVSLKNARLPPPNLPGVGCRLVSPLLPYPRVLSYLHRTLQECIAESGGSSKEATLTLALRMEEPGAKQAIEDLRDLMKMEPELYEAEKLQDEWIADFQNQVDYVPGETGRGVRWKEGGGGGGALIRQKRDGEGREWRVGLNPAVLSTSEDGSKHKTLRVYEPGLRVLFVWGCQG